MNAALSSAALARRRHWIFDMDGTLTVAVHDFDAIRRELELPRDIGILEAIDALPAEDAAERRARLDAIEWRLAEESVAQDGAAQLLEQLAAHDTRLGILTRNDHAIARRTLEAAGLDRWFTPETIIGRAEASPKPDPAGINALLNRWSSDASDAVMIGDFLFDLLAGRAAGSATVYIDPTGAHPHRDHADVVITTLRELVDASTPS